MLASSFDALFALAGWLLLLLLAVASLFPPARGHWSGPLVASPAVLFNLLLNTSIAAGHGKGDPTLLQWVFFASPLTLGVISAGVWLRAVRRQAAG